MRPKKLNENKIEQAMAELENWTRDGDRIRREFRFESFAAAFAFMTRVAEVAEELDHHPDWCNSYNRVDVGLTTHDAGGLSSSDFELARAMDQLAG